MSGAAIEAEGLTLYYGDRAAVNRVTFSVGRGEIFGFLGPNGAGKSTTTRMLTGFLAPSEGSVRLAGTDVARDPTTARELIGIVPEEANVYADLTVWQNVMLMAELHRVGRRRRTERGAELLGLFGLDDRRRQKGRELSKGLRQRLMLCGALVSDPDILFLDEPTSGLDVASAHMIRDIVVRLNRQRAMTVFITTHNIEEAGNLCHRVGIIDRGQLVAIDTPQHLRRTVESRRSVEVRFEAAIVPPGDLLDGLATSEVVPLADGFRLYTAHPGPLAQEIATRASARGLRLSALSTQAPSLEDVFLHITAHGLAPSEAVAYVG
ncbi:ABC transporter ATP-binding protein [Bradyrhizobium sp. 35]|nr:ABC transporter ATP-binding protein [Bradyrhizobium sp. 35]